MDEQSGRTSFNTILRSLLGRLNFLDLRVWSLKGSSHEKKINYQSRFIDFEIHAGETVLDAGSGGEPFPLATHLMDLYLGDTQHRYNPLVTQNKPLIRADIHHIPFKNQAFDFVYCAHVLEHVEDPARACEELMRVARRGYIETPRRTSDFLFNLIKKPDFHRWQVSRSGNTLIFIEYQDDERRDTGCQEIYLLAHSRFDNPIRRLVRRNMDLIKVMFLWKKSFDYYVFNKRGQLVASSQ